MVTFGKKLPRHDLQNTFPEGVAVNVTKNRSIRYRVHCCAICRFSTICSRPVSRTTRILVDARKLDQLVFRQRDLVHACRTGLQLVRTECTTSLNEIGVSVSLDFLGLSSRIYTSRMQLIILLVELLCASATAEILETIAQWPLLDFALPYEREFLNQYRPENVVPTGIEIGWDRIFVSVPRLRAGIPATLNYIPRNLPLESSPQLHAYPSWDWHAAGRGDLNCSTLISVYRTKLDKCDRLWVVDSGVMTSIEDFRPVCPPKIMVFDSKTNQLTRQFTFPREVLRPNTLLTNMIIDDTAATTCDDVFLYISDTTGPGMLVFDGATERSWRVVHATMYPHPDFSTYRIGSDTFELLDGVVGLGFSARLGTVYYQPLATDRLFSVPTTALQAGPPSFGEQLPVTLVGKKSSQGLALAVDPRDDTILFSPLTETAIAAWQPQTNRQRILAYNPEKLQFVAEIRCTERDDGNYWLLSTRFQKFFRQEVNARDINIRLMRLVPMQYPKHPTNILNSFSQPYFPPQFYNNTIGF
ncbi:protein yellow isoform X2 [Frieseomelitta varia]|uniref:protein yellow isoform X2 n=1 Tax=Frieseomelitta varia TaxID=561572 RepID=UPI001CB69139|nr:protein yellow isoform X2 [Frieseomelitta varia]